MTATDQGDMVGSGGSKYNAQKQTYEGVPYGPLDFNCCNCHMCGSSNCGIDSYHDANQVRNCRLVGMLDLALGRFFTILFQRN